MDSKVLTRKIRLSESYARFAANHLQYDEGEKVFEHARKIKNSIELKSIYINFLLKYKKNERAKDLLIEQISHSKKNAPWIKLSKLYEDQGNYREAIEIYEKLIKRNPSNGNAWSLLRNAENKLKQKHSTDTIKKSISFEPKFHSSGLAILQNFGLLLNKKYPDGDVAFTIEQQGMKITMVIEHPHGHKEIVEDYLNRYGLAVSGTISPEQFLTDPVEIMDLKRQLIQYEADIKWANEKQRMLEGTIIDRDNQISFFQDQLKSVLSNNQSILISSNDLLKELTDLAKDKDKSITILVERLIDSAKTENHESIKEISAEINKKSPTIMAKIDDLLIASISSASGNAPAWIAYLSRILS